MARSAKTNHVLSLVGKKASKSDIQHNSAAEKSDGKTTNESIIPPSDLPKPANPALFLGEKKDNAGIPNANLGDYSLCELDDNSENPFQSNRLDNQISSEAVPNNQETEAVVIKADENQKDRITAVVLQLINQELEEIVKRFNIEPNDNNLWQLTKAALEKVRPEFSLNSRQYEEKCDKLRQQVILEMTKKAIKLSKDKRSGK